MRDYYAPRRTYVGHYKFDEHNTYFEHGLGYYDVPLTGKCAAQFDHGTVSGVAVKTWQHGEKYIGEYSLDKKQGVGVHVWPSGARYYGQFDRNMPEGYGVLETVHKGIKFVGKVSGMIAVPQMGQWYKDDKPVTLEELEIDGAGCLTLEDGTIINAVGERIKKYQNEEGEWVTRHEEKNIVTEHRIVPPFNFHVGKRDTTHYGDWIRTYYGHFLSGRYHGKAHVEQLGAPDYDVNWILGSPVEFDTYSSHAFELQPHEVSRAVERRMTRKYCAIYDLAVQHLIEKSKHPHYVNKPLVIVELGVGRGDHLKHLQKVFPKAKIIGVDLLTLDHVAKNELEQQQLSDLRVAVQNDTIRYELGKDCYDQQVIYDIVSRHGKIDLAIHDATHGTQVWDQLETVRECLDPHRGILISEEMCSTPDHRDEKSVDWRQVKLAKQKGWRIWDLRPLNYHSHTNSLIGIQSSRKFEADQLSLYEV